MVERAEHMVFSGGHPFVITLDISESPESKLKVAEFHATDGNHAVAWERVRESPIPIGEKTLLSLILRPPRTKGDPISGNLIITLIDPRRPEAEPDEVKPVLVLSSLGVQPCCNFCITPPTPVRNEWWKFWLWISYLIGLFKKK